MAGIPFKDCIFTLDGVDYKGVESFLDKLIKKDVEIHPNQEARDIAEAEKYGFEHPVAAIRSVNKRVISKDATTFRESAARLREQGDEEGAKKLEERAAELIESGTYKTFSEIPKEELEKASRERKVEHFNEQVDKAAEDLINFLTPPHMKDVHVSGLSLADVVHAGADIIKAAHKAGLDLVKALEDAVKYIKDNWDAAWGSFDEDETRRALRETIMSPEEKKDLTQQEIDEALSASTRSKSILEHIATSSFVDDIKHFVKNAGLAFHPAMFEGKDLARQAMMLIRKIKGGEARENELADIASRNMMHQWNFIPKKEKLGFILSLENAAKYGAADPKFKRVADEYRKRMDAVFDMISKIKDIPYLEDYFPHFWAKPEEARAHFASAYSKRPLEGSKSFLKARFYADILEGMRAGLKLATDNPEEMVRLAEMNALKFQTAHDIFGEMKDRGLMKYFRSGEQPEGWKLVDDPLFKRMALFTVGKGEDVEAAMSRGGYYMPEPVARVVNNYLSRGLAGGGPVARGVYQTVRQWNNIKNLFQLGMGFFHFTTTTVDSTVTGVGNAINKILGGKPMGLLDLASAATVIPNIARTLIAGDRAIRKYRTGQIAEDVQAMTDANARTGLAKIYTLDSYYNMTKALGRLRADNDYKAIPKLVGNTLLILPEVFAKPLMEWYVPRLKVGGFLRSLENELNLKKGLTPDQILRERQRIWDDMDDRLGQMVYDNMFWNKSMKDIAFMTIRSFGWTGGTIRAFGKGIGDVPISGQRLIKGEGISPRTAWLLSLPTMVGLYGAMYQYMMTGKGPDEAKDYFFPKDGSLNPDGTPHRVSLPSYMKDIFAYMKHPLQTAGHKTAPTVNEVLEIFSNKDFYGTQIWNPKDPIYQQGLDVLQYEAQSLIPFSFKTAPGSDVEFGSRQWIEQKFGIMPAVKEFQRTPVQNAIMVQAAKGYSDQAKTKEQADRYSAMGEVRERLFKGEIWEQLPEDLKKRSGYDDTVIYDATGQNPRYKSESFRNLIRDAKLDPYKRKFRELPSEGQLEVWAKMSDEDKKEYVEYLNNKDSFIQLHDLRPEIFDEETEKAYQEIIKEAHETRGSKKKPPQTFN